jgi:hypothetical protein
MSKNTQTAGITPEMIAQFIADKTAKEEAAKKAAKSAEKSKPKGDNDRRNSKDVQEDYPGLALHYCTVKGGRKFDDGMTVECHWVGRNKFRQDTARIMGKDGKPIMIDGKDKGWIDPKFLKGGKELPDARKAAIEASRETESDETILVPASVGREQDKSVLLNYSGWFSGAWLPKSMVEKMGETEQGLGVFSIPAWKVRKDKGSDALEALRAKQDAIKASIVESSEGE